MNLPPPPPAPLPPPAASAQPINVLVVDDFEQNLLAMQALLARDGLQVLIARSGAEALELLLKHEVALALLDVQMPEMDGFALAELMRGTERTRQVPIIFVTAGPQNAQRQFRGYEAGAVDFLHKPIDPHILASKVGVFVELHAQRRRLSEQMAALEQALALNETMAAVLTHDLRTPLQSVTLSAALLLKVSKEDVVRQAAERVRASGQRMARMIDALLDFTSLRRGLVQLQPGPADLEAVARQVAAEVAQAQPHARIEIETRGRLDGRFDADRIAQALTNLVCNAAQHGEDGAVRVVLDGADPALLRARVHNGGALPAGVAAELFTPFRRGIARREASGSSGLGLGLFIVEQFVRAHGGEVQGGSVGEETVFEFALPRGSLPAGSLPPHGVPPGD